MFGNKDRWGICTYNILTADHFSFIQEFSKPV